MQFGGLSKRLRDVYLAELLVLVACRAKLSVGRTVRGSQAIGQRS